MEDRKIVGYWVYVGRGSAVLFTDVLPRLWIEVSQLFNSKNVLTKGNLRSAFFLGGKRKKGQPKPKAFAKNLPRTGKTTCSKYSWEIQWNLKN